MSFEFHSADSGFFKSTDELLSLPSRPWIFGMGDVVVAPNAPPRRWPWLYAPIFRNYAPIFLRNDNEMLRAPQDDQAHRDSVAASLKNGRKTP